MAAMIQKADAEHAVRALCHEWRNAKFGTIAGPDLRFIEFFNWLRVKHPHRLEFRRRTSVRDSVELWFDDEFGRMARR